MSVGSVWGHSFVFGGNDGTRCHPLGFTCVSPQPTQPPPSSRGRSASQTQVVFVSKHQFVLAARSAAHVLFIDCRSSSVPHSVCQQFFFFPFLFKDLIQKCFS